MKSTCVALGALSAALIATNIGCGEPFMMGTGGSSSMMGTSGSTGMAGAGTGGMGTGGVGASTSASTSTSSSSGTGGGGSGGSAPSCTDTYGCETGTDGVFLYVDAAAAPGGAGTMAEPFDTLQQAFSAVGAGQHATLCVAGGAYPEHVGNTADTFSQDRRYTLVGGFAPGFGARDCAAHATVVQAPDKSAAALTFGNVRAITIDGFAITGGSHGIEIVAGYSAGRSLRVIGNHIYANGNDGEPSHRGAGILVSGGDILIQGNVIEGNTGGRLGAGIFVGGAPSSEQNQKDVATQMLTVGSGLAVITDNLVKDNTLRHDTPHGVGIAVSMNAVIRRNVVMGNIGYAQPGGGEAVGGGIFVQNPYVTALVADNWVEGNTALKGGPGIFIDEAAIAAIVNNVVIHNVAEPGGGALLVDGRAGGSGTEDRGYATIANNTVADNQGGGVTVQDATAHVFNNVFWNNGSADFALAAGGAVPESLVADHNRFDGNASGPGFTIGAHNVTATPLFVAAGDYHPSATSPLRDLGVLTFPPAFAYPGALAAAPPADHDGHPRPAGAGVDLGAYEAAP